MLEWVGDVGGLFYGLSLFGNLALTPFAALALQKRMYTEFTSMVETDKRAVATETSTNLAAKSQPAKKTCATCCKSICEGFKERKRRLKKFEKTKKSIIGKLDLM